jgi:hypothetical protein
MCNLDNLPLNPEESPGFGFPLKPKSRGSLLLSQVFGCAEVFLGRQMPVYEGTEQQATYNTITAEAPAPDKASNGHQVVLCMEDTNHQLAPCFGSNPQLTALAPVLFLLPYFFGWSLFLIVGNKLCLMLTL